MPSKPLPNDFPVYTFSTAADFEAFLECEHLTAPGILLKLAKKSSGIPSISAAEAVEVALCYGWIDGRANTIDSDWWMVRYTPRRAKSIWSQKNVNTIARLKEQGRMRAAGDAAVRAAQADGRWDRAYAGPATISVPADFEAALLAAPTAAAFFQSLNRSERYAVLWRVETASLKTRANRIQVMIQNLSTGEIPGAASKKATRITKPKARPKSSRAELSKIKSPTSSELKSSEKPIRTGLRSGLRSQA